MVKKKSSKGSTGGGGTTRFLSLVRFLNLKFLMVFTGLLAGLACLFAVWYYTLPSEQQNEFRLLVENWRDPYKAVTFWDVAEDCYAFRWGTSVFNSHEPISDSLFSSSIPRVTAPDNPLLHLQNKAYRVGYCDKKGNPSWVSYRLYDVKGPRHISKRPPFDTDDRTAIRIKPSDYRKSGYDRGHLAPNFAIARCYGNDAQKETFLMSNMVPQKHKLNAGVWKNVEMYELQNLAARYQQVWVVAGPVFYYDSKQKINDRVVIPDAFFKIILMRNYRGVFARAYLFPMDAAESSPEAYRVSIDRIEELTGLDVFSELPDDLELPLEAAA